MSHDHAGGCCGGSGPPGGGGGGGVAPPMGGASAAAAAAAADLDASTRATAALLAELEGLAFDPALEGCCRRDVEQQVRSGRVKLALQAADRTAARVRARARAVATDPSALAAAAAAAAGGEAEAEAWRQRAGGEGDGLEGAGGPPGAAGAAADPRVRPSEAASGGGGGGGDAELEALRAARLQQMRAAAARAEGGRGVGYGKLNDVPPGKLLALVEELGGRAVAHLAAEGTVACDHLDEQLTGLAHTYRGTYFARVPIRRAYGSGGAGNGGGGGGGGDAVAELRSRLGLAALPALVAFRGGAVVGRAPVAQFGGGADIIEEEVFGYLRRLRVLSEGGGGDAGAGGSSGGEEDEEEGAGGAAPCELCGRTFPHEHIRAMYRGGLGDEDEGSDLSSDGGV